MDSKEQEKQCIFYSGVSQNLTNDLHIINDLEIINEIIDMENKYTETCEIKGKVKLQFSHNKIILTDIYYSKSYNNIIVITKFMSEVFKIIFKCDTIDIIKDKKQMISTCKIKTIHVFVISL